MLLVEQRIGNSNFWIPPQTERKDEETMIQARRSIHCFSKIKAGYTSVTTASRK